MAKKVDVCPECEVSLQWDRDKHIFCCPRIGCMFEDRRSGYSMVEPTKDRRGEVTTAWDTIKKWENVR